MRATATRSTATRPWRILNGRPFPSRSPKLEPSTATSTSPRRKAAFRSTSRQRRKKDSTRSPSAFPVRTRERHNSRQDLLHHLRRLDSRQLLIEALELEAELLVIDAEEVKDGRIQIADVHGVLDD